MTSPCSAELGGLAGKKDRDSSCKGQQPLGPGTSMMQMWNLHSQCRRLACLPACQCASQQPGQRGHSSVLGPVRTGWLRTPRSAGTSPRRALRCAGGVGPRLWLGRSCWNLAVSLGFPASAPLAPWLGHPAAVHGKSDRTPTRPLSIYLASPRGFPEATASTRPADHPRPKPGIPL